MYDEIKHLSCVQRWDANESAFFARELESIKSKVYGIAYPNLRARDFVPTDGSAGVGATSVTYQQFDRAGRARIVSPNAKDIPRVDVFGAEFNRPVRPWADAYGWTVMEAQSAAMAKRNLNSMRASAARRAIEEGLDETAAVGAPDFGIASGLLNSAAVPSQSVPNGAGGFPQWTTKTPDEILADVSLAIQRIVAASLGVEYPNTVIIPDAEHAYIATTPRSATSDTTILEFILRSFPRIQAVEPWYRCTGIGAGSSDRMVVYDRSPDKLSQDVTQEFTQLPVQEQGLELIINCFAQTAGTMLPYPLSIDYSDDIG